MPANTRVAGAKFIPGGRVPPAQVRAYVYGGTPPSAGGSSAKLVVADVERRNGGGGDQPKGRQGSSQRSDGARTTWSVAHIEWRSL